MQGSAGNQVCIFGFFGNRRGRSSPCVRPAAWLWIACRGPNLREERRVSLNCELDRGCALLHSFVCGGSSRRGVSCIRLDVLSVPSARGSIWRRARGRWRWRCSRRCTPRAPGWCLQRRRPCRRSSGRPVGRGSSGWSSGSSSTRDTSREGRAR